MSLVELRKGSMMRIPSVYYLIIANRIDADMKAAVVDIEGPSKSTALGVFGA